MNDGRRGELASSLARMPSIPAVMVEILAAIEDPDFALHRLAAIIGRDQALVTRVLRTVNSPFYGTQGRVASVESAAMVLGASTLKSLAAAAALIDAFPSSAVPGFCRIAFWSHSIGTALAARALANPAGVDPATAFTAGLLHDLGRLALIAVLPAQYAQALALVRAGEATLLDAERRLLGCDHQEAGDELARRWRFAPEIRSAMVGHHLADDARPEPFLAAIHVADVVAHGLEFGAQAGELVPPVSTAAWSRLGIGWEAFREALVRVEGERAAALALITR